jgi:hypothetical protein
MAASGRGTLQSFPAALEYLRQSVDAGTTLVERAPAEYFLAALLAQGSPQRSLGQGESQPPDYSAALMWLERARASGHPVWAPRAQESFAQLDTLLQRSNQYATAVVDEAREQATKATAPDAPPPAGATSELDRKIGDALARHRSNFSTSSNSSDSSDANPHPKNPPQHPQSPPGTRKRSGAPQYPSRLPWPPR